MNLLSAAYGTGARLRRRWYERHPERVRRLSRPVISVGNLAVGGSGKTPVVAAIAAMLRDAGQRPVILSRGYARADRTSPVLVVSDGTRVLEPVTASGDEPQMLARQLTGVPVVVGADRFAAGRLAQSRFDVTAFVLDDGFQHVQLARDVDLLVVSASDLDDDVLPTGRLREPAGTAARADALLVYGDSDEAARVASAVGVSRAFSVVRQHGAAALVSPFGEPLASDRRRAIAVAGIARPERFFDALRAQGWEVAQEIRFRDHHPFTSADVARLADSARSSGADVILTTEKDAVRLPELPAGLPPVAFVPLRVTIEPPAAFAAWLAGKLGR